MQLDGTMGGATAILECLAMVKGDTVHLFQGIPDHWENVEFKNVHLPGGFTISGKRGGEITVKARTGGDLSLCLGDKRISLHLDAGEERHIADFC